VSRHLELIFLQSCRKEIKLPQSNEDGQKEKETEEKDKEEEEKLGEKRKAESGQEGENIWTVYS